MAKVQSFQKALLAVQTSMKEYRAFQISLQKDALDIFGKFDKHISDVEQLKKDNEKMRSERSVVLNELNETKMKLQEKEKECDQQLASINEQNNTIKEKTQEMENLQIEAQGLRDNIVAMNDTNAKLVLMNNNETVQQCSHSEDLLLKDTRIQSLEKELLELKKFCNEREVRDQEAMKAVVEELKKNLE